jgi:S1-C subfamily serine protease
MTASNDSDWLANAAAEPDWAAAIGTADSSPNASKNAGPNESVHQASSGGLGASHPQSPDWGQILGSPDSGQISGSPFTNGSGVSSSGGAGNSSSASDTKSDRPRGRGKRKEQQTIKTPQDLSRVRTPATPQSATIANAQGAPGNQREVVDPKLSRRQRKAAEKARAKRRPKPKMRLLPRSVLGTSMLILAAGIGAAISGTGLYMNYAYRRDVSDAQVKGLRTTISKGVEAVNAEGTNARFRIQQELEPLLRQAAIGDTLVEILRDAQPSLWSVRTFDEAGQATVGTAFVVASDAEKSFLLTSLSVVRASVVRPGPDILLQQDKTQAKATLWSWQEDKDIALLIVPTGNLPKIQWAKSDSTKVGTQVFAVSGFGTAGGAVTNGFIADVSTSGVQHSAALGTAFRGGPLLDGTGKVVAVLSKTYSPFGFASDGVWFAPPVTAACDKVLKCPNGQVTGAGPEQPSAAPPAVTPIPTAAPSPTLAPATTVVP